MSLHCVQYAHAASRRGHGTCTDLFTMQEEVFTQDVNFAAASITCTEARVFVDHFLDDLRTHRSDPWPAEGGLLGD